MAGWFRSRRRVVSAGLLALLVAVVLVGQALVPTTAGAAVDRILRVYNDNAENLVWNDSKEGGTGADGDALCSRVDATDHINSMLVSDTGARSGTFKAPDLVILQQLRGKGQADAYAGQLSSRFPGNSYLALYVWEDPATWGEKHGCSTDGYGGLKAKQTNVIIYNTTRLSLQRQADYWSAGWYDDEWLDRVSPPKTYSNGAGCELYKPPWNDNGTTYAEKWRRTSATAAKFTVKGTSPAVTVFAATMHLPQSNDTFPCAAEGTKGPNDSGIRIGSDATSLMTGSTLRFVGIDANKEGIPRNTLSGLTHYGSRDTNGYGSSNPKKIDYLFAGGGTALASANDYTATTTKSNHKALHVFVAF